MEEPKQSSLSEAKTTNVTGSKKEEKETMFHGTTKSEEEEEEDIIEEKTNADDVKGPGVLQRIKEEVVAIFDSVTPTKKSDDDDDVDK